MSSIPEDFPRLAYIGDVPVESSYHGSALLYRLLQNYPPDKLRIVEGNLRRSQPERRLRGVEYRQMRVGCQRWLNTRFHSWISSWLTRTARFRAGQLTTLLEGFAPEAVLTVAHEYSWITAAAHAERDNLRLHLVVHDDWPRIGKMVGPMQSWLEREFGRIYRLAASRLCVSPFMAEEYQRRYGVDGTVLYPSRDSSTPVFDAVTGVVPNKRAFTVAYAGSLATGDYVRQLVVMSRLLSDLGGKLLLFGPFDDRLLTDAGMDISSTAAGGMLASADLIQRLHRDADALFLPMSFSASDVEAMALNFPSKLTDYTATGLPLLIWGPPASSAVKWAASEHGVAAVVTKPNQNDMGAMLKRLILDRQWRNQLAVAAAAVGNRYFGPLAASEIFLSSLTKAVVTNTGSTKSYAR